jgi:peptidoglycan hydrolase CwlO-like protein
VQAVVKDRAASTAQAAQEIHSLKKEVQVCTQQIESAQNSLALQNTSHVQEVKSLQAKMEGISAAAKKEVSKLQAEVESGNKRMEHLQKVLHSFLCTNVLYGIDTCDLKHLQARDGHQMLQRLSSPLLLQVNKEKRQELEKLHIQHNTVQSSASAAGAKVEKLTRDLADSQKRIDELTGTLNQQEAAIKELGELKAMLVKGPGVSKELTATAQV